MVEWLVKSINAYPGWIVIGCVISWVVEQIVKWLAKCFIFGLVGWVMGCVGGYIAAQIMITRK